MLSVKQEGSMVAKPGFEFANSELEREILIHRDALVAFESGSISICGQTAPDVLWKDDTPGYIIWLKAKIDELTALIALNSIPVS